MTEDEILNAMSLRGGEFVRALAKAARLADPDNLARLRKAFPEYWNRYEELARRAKEQR